MDVANLLLRAIDKSGAVFPPFHLEGDWTTQEQMVIADALRPHVPDRVDAMFNEWHFWKHSHSDGNSTFGGKKATWDLTSWWCETVGELSKKITDYYEN